MTKIALVVAIAAILAAFAWGVRNSAHVEQSKALIAAAAMVAAAILGAAITQHESRARGISEAHRLQRTEIYAEFCEIYIASLKLAKVEGDSVKLAEAQAAIVEQMLRFSKRAMLWGSPEVLRAFNSFRASADAGPNVLLRVDDVLSTMRTDLGLSNKGLERGDLVKMYLTDPERLDALRQ